MKKQLLYILITAVIALTAFYIGRNTKRNNDTVLLNSIVDYVPTSTGIILHTVDSGGNINGYILNIPEGVKEWAEKGYHGIEDWFIKYIHKKRR